MEEFTLNNYKSINLLSNNFIYCHTNKVNGKRYIGQTTIGLERFKQKLYSFKRGADSPYLRNAVKKYGLGNFTVEILCYADDIETLNELEEIIIKSENTISPNGYNLVSGGYNKKASESTKKKMSKIKKGKPLTEEQKKNISNSLKGRPFSKKHKENISKSKKGKPLSELCKKGLSIAFSGKNNPMYGKNHTKEAREKIKIAAIGRNHSINSKVNMSKSKNSTGIFRVVKIHDNKFKQGFIWAYQYYDENKVRRNVRSVNLLDLKEKIISMGLDWIIIDEEKANLNLIHYQKEI